MPPGAAADTAGVGRIDWHALDLEPLRAELRGSLPPPEAERMIFAFERAVAVARVDGELLDFLATATICLLASEEGQTPRDVLEALFRCSVSDEGWRARYATLLR